MISFLKRIPLVTLFVVLSCIILSGCKGEDRNWKEKLGNGPAAGEQKYVFNLDGYLITDDYIIQTEGGMRMTLTDLKTGSSQPYCFKTDCAHKLNDYRCNAVSGDGSIPATTIPWFYGGYLYGIGMTGSADTCLYIMRSDIDGSNREIHSKIELDEGRIVFISGAVSFDERLYILISCELEGKRTPQTKGRIETCSEIVCYNFKSNESAILEKWPSGYSASSQVTAKDGDSFYFFTDYRPDKEQDGWVQKYFSYNVKDSVLTETDELTVLFDNDTYVTQKSSGDADALVYTFSWYDKERNLVSRFEMKHEPYSLYHPGEDYLEVCLSDYEKGEAHSVMYSRDGELLPGSEHSFYILSEAPCGYLVSEIKGGRVYSGTGFIPRNAFETAMSEGKPEKAFSKEIPISGNGH